MKGWHLFSITILKIHSAIFSRGLVAKQIVTQSDYAAVLAVGRFVGCFFGGLVALCLGTDVPCTAIPVESGSATNKLSEAVKSITEVVEVGFDCLEDAFVVFGGLTAGRVAFSLTGAFVALAGVVLLLSVGAAGAVVAVVEVTDPTVRSIWLSLLAVSVGTGASDLLSSLAARIAFADILFGFFGTAGLVVALAEVLLTEVGGGWYFMLLLGGLSLFRLCFSAI